MNDDQRILDERIKEFGDLLSYASLFKDEFSIDWLISLSEKKVSEIIEILDLSVKKGWLRKKKQGYFEFTKAAHRSWWQSGLTEAETSRMHKEIADVLMAELPDGEGKARRLSHHLLHVDNDLARCALLSWAGDLYRKSFLVDEALKCYTKILNDLSGAHHPEADALFIDTVIKYSKIADAKFDVDNVLVTLHSAIRRAVAVNDTDAMALLYMHVAKNEWLRSNYDSALTAFKKGWKLSEAVSDPAVRRSALTFSTFFHFWQGLFSDAAAGYTRYAPEWETYPEDRFQFWSDLTAGYCFTNAGQITQGLGMIDSIRSVCQKRGYLLPEALGRALMGVVMLDIHRTDEAMGYLKGAHEAAEKGRHKLMSVFTTLALTYAHYRKGDLKQAASHLKKFNRLKKKTLATMWPYPYLFELLWGMETGRFPAVGGLSLIREIEDALKSRNVFMMGLAYRYQAFLHRKENRPISFAVNALKKSGKWLEKSGHQIELARTRVELARLYVSTGNEKKAKEATDLAAKPLSGLNESFLPEDLRPFFKSAFASDHLVNEILALGQKVVSSDGNKEFLDYLLSTSNRIIGSERAAILVVDPDRVGTAGKKVRVFAAKNFTPDQLADLNSGVLEKIIEEVVRTGRGTVPDSDIMSGIQSMEPIRSIICVPMVFKRKITGALYQDNRLVQSAFKESDLKFLSYFAAISSFAIDYQRVQDHLQNFLKGKLPLPGDESLQTSHFENMVGASQEIKKVLDAIGNVAGTDTNVFVTGETGVGKEVVAKAIHAKSLRASGPFVSVNCNAFPEGLITSELFGHEKGAFTGATQRRIGRFELADGGTLFLDEIGELPMDSQVRLLRVLQTKEFERIGGSQTLHSDFRLISATHRNLDDAVKSGRFREDLYYRLNVFPVSVPPLKNRKEDIPLLARHFLRLFSSRMNKIFENFPEDEMDKLLRYDWPGNVRELSNVIERGVILNRGPVFRVPELKPDFDDILNAGSGTSLKENEKRHITWALQKTNWKIQGEAGAAELLDIHPSTLTSRMKKLGIKRPAKGDHILIVNSR